jgi:hypothetical protein
MTKTEQSHDLAWRLKLLQGANGTPRTVAQACRHLARLARPSVNERQSAGKAPASP